ncbi:MAG: DUF4956 domain-containing protein [Eubacteriales bacterium]
MSFKDFILNSDFTLQELTVNEIAYTLLISLGLSLIIFFVYKLSYQGVMYSKMFNISLIGLSLITSGIILAISKNMLLSLGMVGALSIVRFRTAIKDPIDIIYMYWAIAVGIIVGGSFILLAVVVTAIVAIVLFTFSKMQLSNQLYLLVVEFDKNFNEDIIYKNVYKYCRKYSLKSKTSGDTTYEITLEIRSNYDVSKLVNYIDSLKGVEKTALLSYDGNLAV